MTKMKNLLTLSSIFILILALSSCSDSVTVKEADSNAKDVSADAAIYSADVPNLVLRWTAYKFTTKLGVSGVFEDCELANKSKPGTIEEILTGTQMNIATASVNSNNEIRDPKLRADFFSVLNTPTITAKIVNAKDGKGDMQLTMNGITNDLAYDYSLKNDTIFLNTSLDLLQWDGKEAVDSLNAVCYDLHKGPDGISKLWPDVDVVMMLPVSKQ
jgi:polyisoprenoid-binding protein YceI